MKMKGKLNLGTNLLLAVVILVTIGLAPNEASADKSTPGTLANTSQDGQEMVLAGVMMNVSTLPALTEKSGTHSDNSRQVNKSEDDPIPLTSATLDLMTPLQVEVGRSIPKSGEPYGSVYTSPKVISPHPRDISAPLAIVTVDTATMVVDGNVTTVADRKSTRLNSSHQIISYAVFCCEKTQI